MGRSIAAALLRGVGCAWACCRLVSRRPLVPSSVVRSRSFLVGSAAHDRGRRAPASAGASPLAASSSRPEVASALLVGTRPSANAQSEQHPAGREAERERGGRHKPSGVWARGTNQSLVRLIVCSPSPASSSLAPWTPIACTATSLTPMVAWSWTRPTICSMSVPRLSRTPRPSSSKRSSSSARGRPFRRPDEGTPAPSASYSITRRASYWTAVSRSRRPRVAVRARRDWLIGSHVSTPAFLLPQAKPPSTS